MNGDIVLYFIKMNVFERLKLLLFNMFYKNKKIILKKYILFLTGIIVCSVIIFIKTNMANNSIVNHNNSLFTEQLKQKTMNILIDDKVFTVMLDNSKTVDELLEILPMEIEMSELNGKEKYYYLSNNLTTNSYKPEKINKGDIMLYGDNCLVIFYKTFYNTYNYTYIGHIDDVAGLEEAIGSYNVKVKFEQKN